VYKCTNYYDPSSEVSIKWDDKEIGIEWPIATIPILSDKDEKGLSFQYLFKN
jgi:dTDP-4-dehydrorhamnose 3,5-epimerase